MAEKVINEYKHRYSISKMCKILEISRTVYYNLQKKLQKPKTDKYEHKVISAFKESRSIYGARKIKAVLSKENIIMSRRKIREIMVKNNLVSKYTKLKYVNHNKKVNNEKVKNVIDRKFNNRSIKEVIVSDLTYVQVANRWNYICLLIDLYNREVVGYSTGSSKDANLVYDVFMSTNCSLKNVKIFHTDRGNEFKNQIIDQILEAFEIERSLSKKGCPYDNAVAEATYKIFKTEFINGQKFNSFKELNYKLFDFINWYNNFRIHGSLNYLSPVEYKILNQSI